MCLFRMNVLQKKIKSGEYIYYQDEVRDTSIKICYKQKRGIIWNREYIVEIITLREKEVKYNMTPQKLLGVIWLRKSRIK